MSDLNNPDDGLADLMAFIEPEPAALDAGRAAAAEHRPERGASQDGRPDSALTRVRLDQGRLAAALEAEFGGQPRPGPREQHSDAQGDHLQAIDLRHESDALQNICGAEVGQERRLIQWQSGNCVGMGPAPHARARRVLVRR